MDGRSAPDGLAGQARRLQVLCLHGSRQDGEVFSQRIKTLRRKLSGIADLHFVSSPHELPLQEGQSVPMRAWWRHWHVSPADEPEQQQEQQQGQQQQGQQGQQRQQAPQPAQTPPHGRAREEEVSAMMAAGWEAVVLRDWAASLEHLCAAWAAGPPSLPAPSGAAASASGSNSSSSSLSSLASSAAGASSRWQRQDPAAGASDNSSSTAVPAASYTASGLLQYDGVLGFSNGAAAAFLFAAHAATHPDRFSSLRFVALAGGYVPEPLHKLLPPQLALPQGRLGEQGAAGGEPCERLARKLPFASLHMMGENDPLIDLDDSSKLMQCFQEHGRVQLVHDSGHAVPQQSRWMQELLKFFLGFAELPATAAAAAAAHPRRHRHRSQKAAAAVAAAAGPAVQAPGVVVEAAAAEIEAKLHRQGLRAVVKGQAHQHVDLLSPKSQRSRRLGEQQLSQQQSSFELQLEGATQQQGQQGQHPGQQQTHERQGQEQQQAQQQQQGRQAADFGDATDIQLEELEALEAIFSREFHLVSRSPPTFTIKLREPDPLADGDEGGEDGGGGEACEAEGPPSRLFALRFKLPKEYPRSPSALPLVEVEGPLGKNDPARAALAAHLAALAAEQQADMGGEGGYSWQLAGAAKEWIDEHLPADIGSRRAGCSSMEQQAPLQGSEAAAAGGPAAAVAAGGGGGGGTPWWESDEVDLDLVARATAEAAAVHWRSWDAADNEAPLAAADSSGGDVAAALTSVGEDGAIGRWDYCVGLVGKPSAGKSTLFNALTDPAREEDAAREAPFPFTTISPNVGRGFVVLPDPAPLLGLAEQAEPAHGYALFDPSCVRPEFNNAAPLAQLARDCNWAAGGGGMLWRRVPVVVKDVAGLVPGAYKGRGRGNAFLNDLCDADVLLHVVDASGTTDSEGAGAAPGEGADPLQEVTWVRQELHLWIYDNVRAKWQGVLRRPSRLPQLFSGYHAPPALVAAVLRAVGVRIEDLVSETAAAGNAGLLGGTKDSGLGGSGISSLSAWGEWDLHRLVAHFLAARFPVLLALNKADLPGAQQHIPAVLRAFPHAPGVAVSAAAERQLQQLRRSGLANREADGPSSADATAYPAAAAVVERYGSTGVLAAVTCAVALKPPRWCFPIADRETCAALPAVSSRAAAGGGGGDGRSRHGGGGGWAASAALGWGIDAKARAAQGAAAGVLRDCVLLKPGSRVEDVFFVLKRPPWALLEGEFVRAECRVLPPAPGCGSGGAGGGAHCRVVRKDELIGPSNCVLLLQTNRKVSWQRGHH